MAYIRNVGGFETAPVANVQTYKSMQINSNNELVLVGKYNTLSGSTQSVVFDLNGIIVGGSALPLTTSVNTYIVKYGENGTDATSWRASITSTNVSFLANNVCVLDPSDNIYIVGKAQNSSTTLPSTISFRDNGNGIAVGTDFTLPASSYALYITQYNSSGAPQWRSTITGDTSGVQLWWRDSAPSVTPATFDMYGYLQLDSSRNIVLSSMYSGGSITIRIP
jgi:hypothetical protein